MPPSQTPGGEATREAIIEAAYQLFIQNGYHGTSMRDIAAGAGITAGSIYNHFTDKEQIFKAVILAYHPLVLVVPRLMEVEGQSAEELIRDAARRIAQEIEARPGIVRIFATELIELGGRHINELIITMLPQVQGILTRIYSTGAIIRPPDPLPFFRMFLSMMIGYAVTHMVFDTASLGLNEPHPMAALAEQPTAMPMDEYIEVILWGVLGNPPYEKLPAQPSTTG